MQSCARWLRKLLFYKIQKGSLEIKIRLLCRLSHDKKYVQLCHVSSMTISSYIFNIKGYSEINLLKRKHFDILTGLSSTICILKISSVAIRMCHYESTANTEHKIKSFIPEYNIRAQQLLHVRVKMLYCRLIFYSVISNK